MRVRAWDTVFVRSRRGAVHAVLRRVDDYGRWWPGVRSQRLDAATVQLVLRPPGWLPRRQLIVARVTRERADVGLDLRFDGDVRGQAEWYFGDERAGVLVHYLLRAQVAERRWRRTLADHRAVVRQGLHALKDQLEAGRRPGEEPAPELLGPGPRRGRHG